MSDHFAVQCKLDFAKPPLERKEVIFRKIRSIDFDNFRYELECSSLVSHPSEVLDVLVEQYNKTLEALLDSHAPLKRKMVTIRPHTPWYTEEIATEKRKRRSLERRWRSSRQPSDYQNYVIQCDVVNNLLSKSKASYYRDVIENSKHDQRVLFQTVNKLLHTKLETFHLFFSPPPPHEYTTGKTA